VGKSKADDDNPILPVVTVNEIAEAVNATLETKQTKPPTPFTEGTLIAAMKSVGKSITDAKLKKILRETAGLAPKPHAPASSKPCFSVILLNNRKSRSSAQQPAVP